LLAQAGMTGPPEVLAGEHALDNLVGKFELPALAGSGGDFRIAGVTLKFFLSEGHSLSPITAALELCGQVAVEDIETVRVHTYRWAWNVIGRGREKWRPATREDADHSMPYVVAATLLDRGFSDAVFDLPRLQDPRLLKLIDRVEVVEDPALTRQFPEKLPCRIEITTRSGATRVAEVEYPRGHHHNPMSDDEVSAKFRDLAQRKLSPERAGRALDAMWRLSGAPGLDAIFDSVRIGD